MAQIGHGLAEIVAAVVAFRVVFAGFDVGFVFLQIGVDVGQEGFVDVVFGQDVVVVDLIELHLVGHFEGIGDHFRMVGEKRGHFLLALEILLLRVAQPLGIVHVGVGGQADEAVVGRAILLADEVHVVGGHHLDALFARQVEQDGVHLHLRPVHVVVEAGHFGLVLHHLEVVILPEHALMPAQSLAGGFHVAVHNVAGQLARQARGAADQVLVILLDDFVRDARLVVHAVDMPFRADLHQVLVSCVVLGQEGQVVVFAMVVVLEPMVVVPCHIDFAADDGLDQGLLVLSQIRLVVGEFEELLHAVHIAVVGDGQGGHAQLPGAGEQFLDVGQTVENRILRMDVKVYEGHGAML